MAGLHDTIIANAAKRGLSPLGLVRKGRSRIWIADHGWWAIVVEFQPSSWSKGTYLNVAAHWLWSPADHLSFDFGSRFHEHVPYDTDEQFAQAVAGLVEAAAEETLRLAGLFPSISAAAVVLSADEPHGWSAYHAGVAAGIAGLEVQARAMLERALSGFATSDSLLARDIRRLAALTGKARDFREAVHAQLIEHRAALRLPVLSSDPFEPDGN